MMQLLQTMMADREAERAERQANLAALQQIAQNNQGHGNHDHPGSKLKNFQNTNPPMFNKTEEPLDADDWLQTMENNLEVAGVEAEKVATHYTRTCQSLVNKCPCNECGTNDDLGRLQAEKYRNNSSGGFAPRYNKPPAQNNRPNYTNNNGGPPKPGNNNNNHPNNSNNNGNNNNTNTAPRTGSNATPVIPKDKSTVNCYECGVVGHYSNECPKKLAKIAANTAAPVTRRFAVEGTENNNGVSTTWP
ncbi:hypothetical protein QYE76_048769 [Lolium multiflorum]|uniref:CCHC-type domain-containing protein n=1 Tax=Lolium multiflorum TaxID=4521 RepID=A0AAD8WHN9_LOLMU|nr:hypothetical protein QYE76_048769 [Lolium multiflorum]